MRKIKPEKVDALRTLVTGAFGSDDNAEEVAYLENQSPVSKADIDAKYAEMLAEWDAQAYARVRKDEYPSYAEQFDILYHKGVAGLKAELKKTKDKYPKLKTQQ